MNLISEEYLELQKKLHRSPRGYGGRGSKWAATVRSLRKIYGAETVLDYGCGQGSLARSLAKDFKVAEYDPAIKGKSSLPSAADLVVCTDVLEHIEPDKLDCVLDHLRSITQIAALLVISLVPASKILADGRNAHLIVESKEWWRQKLDNHGFTCSVELNRGLAPHKAHKEWAVVVT